MSATTAMPTDAGPADDAPLTAAAFDALYRETVDDLYAYVATLVRDRAAAEDVVAAAFERAYRRLRTYDRAAAAAASGCSASLATRRSTSCAAGGGTRRSRPSRARTSPGSTTISPTRCAARPSARRLPGSSPATASSSRSSSSPASTTPRSRASSAISPSNAGTRLHRAVHRLREACHAPS